MSRRPVVYVIMQPSMSRHKPPPNLSPLYEHGEVKVLLPAGSAPTYEPDKARRMLEAGLESFDPAVDFLVWAGGDTLAAVLTGVILERRAFDDIQWLRVDRPRLPDGSRDDSRAKYVPVDVPLVDYDDDDDDPTHEANMRNNDDDQD